MSIRAQIMALPPEDRLTGALDLLDEMTGADGAADALRRRFGLSPCEAQILATLNHRAPAPVPRMGIYAALYGLETERTPRTIIMLVCKLRRKLGDAVQIETARGVGYRLAAKIPEAA